MLSALDMFLAFLGILLTQNWAQNIFMPANTNSGCFRNGLWLITLDLFAFDYISFESLLKIINDLVRQDSQQFFRHHQ